MNKSKSLLACVLCALAFSCAPAKAVGPMPTWLLNGATLVGAAFAVNTLGYIAGHTLYEWKTEKLKPVKYGLMGSLGVAGLIANILFIKAALLMDVGH